MELHDPLPVTSDERRIKQVIMNLVSNAIKFTETGRVDVTVEQKGTVAEVECTVTPVSVSGTRMYPMLFHPFGRSRYPAALPRGRGWDCTCR